MSNNAISQIAATMGRKGGQATSAAKKSAARANAKLPRTKKDRPELVAVGGPLHPAERAYWRMYGKGVELPAEEKKAAAAVALRALEEMAAAVRCYGASAGLALLCGRICARMEHSPQQAGAFAARVGRARTSNAVSHIKEVSKG